MVRKPAVIITGLAGARLEDCNFLPTKKDLFVMGIHVDRTTTGK